MGTSTDAILLYGYAWDEESEKPWLRFDDYEYEEYKELDDLDFEDFLLHRHKFQADDPWEEWGQILQDTFDIGPDESVPYDRYSEKEALYREWRDKNKDRLDKFYKDKKDFLKKLQQDVELGRHCSGDYPMYYISIEEAHHQAGRGYPTELAPEDLVVSVEKRAEWDARLKAFCEMAGIEIPEKFGWFLVSYWC